MDIKQLRTFRSVAELGSLSKAADRLRTTQPGLSRQIKLLEQELGVQLFVRNGRGMLLTIAGRMLLDRTEGLVRQIEQVRDDIKSTGGNPAGRVVLGLVPTVSAVLAGRLAHRVLSQFPDISLGIVESTAATWSSGCIGARWTSPLPTGRRSICTSPRNPSAMRT